MPYTEMGTTEIKLALIAGHAKRNPNMQFTSLAHLLDIEFLTHCFYGLYRNKAVGVDDVSLYDYEVNLEVNLTNLVDRLRSKKFKPIPYSSNIHTQRQWQTASFGNISNRKCKIFTVWLKKNRNKKKPKG
jgi:hypothetical protein